MTPVQVGGQELKDRITNEASNNALVVSLFLTMSMPALMNPPSEISDYLRSVYMLMWTVPVCLQVRHDPPCHEHSVSHGFTRWI